MPGFIPNHLLETDVIATCKPIETRLEDKISEVRALKDCLNFLYPLAADQDFVLCAKHILLARDAAKFIEDELKVMLKELRS